MNFLLTYLLIIPYITVIIYFFIYKRDNFFLKIRSSVQLLLILILLGFMFVNILLWKGFFEEYTFLNFDIRNTATQFKTTALVTALAAVAAVFGWIFTSRVQIINTVRSHSVQVLMNSRNSTVYIAKVDEASKLRRLLAEEAKKAKENEKQEEAEEDKAESGQVLKLTAQRYAVLGNEEKSAVTYLLNFLEFVAIGIRHNNLDEDLIKGSFKSILKSNYVLFQPVIEYLRTLDSPKTYNQLEMLHKRWDDERHSKCSTCKEWFHVGADNSKTTKAKKIFMHICLTLITSFVWLMLIAGMKITESLTTHKEDKSFTCIDCGGDKE